MPGKGLQIDSQLLAFFVQMTSLQSQGFGGLGDVAIVSIEFGEDRGSFEGEDAL